jgi:hypothetical protein
MYAEIGITQVSDITCRSMFRNPQTCISHSVNQWGMMIEIVDLTISCMRGRGTYPRFKAKYNTPQYNSLGRGKFNPHDGYKG